MIYYIACHGAIYCSHSRSDTIGMSCIPATDVRCLEIYYNICRFRAGIGYIEETTVSFLLFLWHFIYTSVSVQYRRTAH